MVRTSWPSLRSPQKTQMIALEQMFHRAYWQSGWQTGCQGSPSWLHSKGKVMNLHWYCESPELTHRGLSQAQPQPLLVGELESQVTMGSLRPRRVEGSGPEPSVSAL